MDEEQLNKYYLRFKELADESHIKAFHPGLLSTYKLLKPILRSKARPLLQKLYELCYTTIDNAYAR